MAKAATTAAIVYAAGWPLTLVPLDVTEQVRLTPERLAEVAAGAPPAIAAFASAAVASFMQPRPGREPGFTLHDPLALAVALDSAVVETEAADVSVELCRAGEVGRTVPTFRPGGNLRAATGVDRERALAMFEAGLRR